jgi:REP element-mobilizing transposase RayT
MPRQARIDIPGLLQHVIVRGIERSKIFLNDYDRENFIARLNPLLEETQTICYAWAMLDNHVHLLLMPTKQPLSCLMRRLLTGYAVSFNLRHNRKGYLFQNRYKSIVCDGDAYLMELIRYIHLNPVRAQVVNDLKTLAEYLWCGHRQMLGLGDKQLIIVEDVLALFSCRIGSARKAYMQFLAEGLSNSTPEFSRGGRRASQSVDSSLTDKDLYDDRILGGSGFVERILEQVQPVEVSRSLDVIIETVSSYFELSPEEMSWPSKERKVASAKAIICYLATRHHRLSGVEVAAILGYTPSAVSHATKRGRMLLGKEHALTRAFE